MKYENAILLKGLNENRHEMREREREESIEMRDKKSRSDVNRNSHPLQRRSHH